jgi:hypothetical protein
VLIVDAEDAVRMDKRGNIYPAHEYLERRELEKRLIDESIPVQSTDGI